VLLQESPSGAGPVQEPVHGGGGGATATATATSTMAAPRRTLRVLDLDRRELAVVTPLIALIIALGVYPQPLIDLIQPAVSATMSDIGADSTGTGGTAP
jgi:NADH-quinone oxidoreductase subunit M